MTAWTRFMILIALVPIWGFQCDGLAGGECEPGAIRCRAGSFPAIEQCVCRGANSNDIIYDCHQAPAQWEILTGECVSGDQCVARGNAAICVAEHGGPCQSPSYEESCIDAQTRDYCKIFIGENADGQGGHHGIATLEICPEGTHCQMDEAGFAGCWLNDT